jgi:hypothetical protein
MCYGCSIHFIYSYARATLQTLEASSYQVPLMTKFLCHVLSTCHKFCDKTTDLV